MKHIRILLSAIAIGLVAAVATVHAQESRKGKGKAGGRVTPQEFCATVDKEVGGLTDAQKTKITDIVTKTQEQMQALPQDERREKGRTLMQAQNDQVRAVLNAEQQKKFDEAQAQRKQKAKKNA